SGTFLKSPRHVGVASRWLPHGNFRGLARTGVEYREPPKRGTKVAKIEPRTPAKEKDHERDQTSQGQRRQRYLSGPAAARHRRLPLYDRAAVRRAREVDQCARGGDAFRQANPACGAEERR